MESVLMYDQAPAKELTGFVREETASYKAELDRATELFNERMSIIEKRCQESNANPDEMLIVTTKAIMDMCNAAEQFELRVGFDKATLKQIRSRFREATNRFISKSYFTRGREWPQGYPGDYQIIESIYRNTPVSNGIGYYLDRYALATTLSVAVRERKETLRDLLAEELSSRNGLNILDVACGSCREVFELASDIQRTDAKVICVDFDSDALDFAANRMSGAGLISDNITFSKYNALKMVNHERNLKEFGMQDVIYSVGFFDYLDDDLLIRLLGSLYKLLSPGGKLITSFKDCSRYRTFDTSWLLDWDAFYQRTEEDMRDILDRAGIPREALTTTREKSGVIVFFTATK